tara:strand:+ start:974 stop:1675 length:702 start_codon:yes stop_codon:yes gene_type:complete
VLVTDGKFDLANRARSAETTLDLLGAVAEDGHVSQRNLADRLGIALGLTNAVLKRCLKKGLLKIQQVPARRYAYYLTPKGFAEKSRLTAEYLSTSLQFYRSARQEYTELFQYCETRGWNEVLLVGATELAEIASLAAHGANVSVIGILDPGRNEASFCGLPVWQALKERPHAVILADTTDPQGAYEQLIRELPAERVLTPRLMRVTTAPQEGDRIAAPAVTTVATADDEGNRE